MQQFNVLDRHLPIHRHYLLEASAGTGKTFSIQNIVVRLLIQANEGVPLNLEQILVVTFTRAATRDLKQRIRLNIEQAICHLYDWLKDSQIPKGAPDYLVACMEEGEQAVLEAKKRLQQALFAFDRAQIFTIHSFCSRMLMQHALECDIGLFSPTGEEPLPQTEVMRVIRDFLRTEVRADVYSPGQLTIILKEDPEQKKLLRILMSGYEVIDVPAFNELFEQFKKAMQALKSSLGLTAERMIEDFKVQAGGYRNYKNGETKAETFVKISHFASLFDKEGWEAADFDLLIRDGLVWTKALDSSLLKSRCDPSAFKLTYPDLTRHLQNHLEPVVRLAGDFSFLLARLAKDCQRLLRRYQREEEKLSPDDLLKKMHVGLSKKAFLTKIQSLYQAAIIDEFQDTDPIQWDIFQRLFLPQDSSWKGHLYLVGDPKQSIYSFRQADIYTYLAAAKALGQQACFSLDTNYRSQPSLVQALNVLLSSEHIPSLIPLPKYSQYLPYYKVQASSKVSERDFKDGKGALHFFIGDGSCFKKAKLQDLESGVFFPFIASEIENLKEQEKFSYSQFAVLVRDRHQALRLAEFLDKKGIPYVNQRGMSLTDSPALPALIDLLRAVLHPRDHGIVKAALGSPLLGWTHEELRQLSQLDHILLSLHRLRKSLFEKGFALFFQDFLYMTWHPDGMTVLERLLVREGGREFYHDLQQIVDIVLDHHYREWSGPEGLIPFLDRFSVWQANEDERIKRFQDPTKNGIKILTLHFSKGLEFDVVFALGLINRSWTSDELIPIEKNSGIILSPPVKTSPEYKNYFEEIDAEKMRQLYVALTRAKHRLYVPVALHLSSEGLELGEASPIDLFLARLENGFCSCEEIYEKIHSYDGKALFSFLDKVGKDNSITYSVHQVVSFEKQQEEERANKLLQPPKKVVVPGSFSIMTSFSHLASSLKGEHILPSEAPSNFENSDKTVHTLPANSETGIVVHQILEKLPFSLFKSIQTAEQALPLISPLVQRSLFKDWQETLATLVFHSLKTPFFLNGSSFCLADLELDQMYKEMPFLFPYDASHPIEGVELLNGLIRGVIDLIFSYKGKYYILDWKTNWLGPSAEYYEKESLQKAMQSHHYFLQANLYVEALRRYLRLVEKRAFRECFGGVIYLFLRGLNPEQDTGIYVIEGP